MVATGAGSIAGLSGDTVPDVEALIEQGQALAKEQQFDEALRVLEQAVRLAPECEQAVVTYRKTVSRYTKQLEQNGQYQYVCDVFDHALTLLPDSYVLLNDYGCSSTNVGEFNKASQLFKRSIAINNRHVPTYISYTKILVSQGNDEQMVQLLEQFTVLDNLDIKGIHEYGRFLRNEGHYQWAIQLFEKALAVDSHHVKSYISYTKLLTDWGKDQEVILLLERFMNLDNLDAKTIRLYARALHNQGNDKWANLLFEKALTVDARDVITLHGYAEILIKQGNDARAAQLLEQALDIDNHHVSTYITYTKLLGSHGRDKEATRLLEKFIALDNLDAKSIKKYAKALKSQGNDQWADLLFERALPVDSDIIALSSYVQLLTTQGYNDRADQLLRKLITLQNIDVKTINEHARFLSQGNDKCAAQLFEQALNIDACYTPTYFSYAKLLITQGNDERLTQLVDKFIALENIDASIINEYARFLMRQGHHKWASQLFERALIVENCYASTYFSYAKLLITEENNERLTQLLEKFIALKNIDVSTINEYARFLIRQGHHRWASQLFEKSLAIDDRHVITLNSYAQLLMKHGNDEQAALLLEQALTLDDRNVIILRNYAQLLMKQGNEIKASQLFERLSSLNGHDVVTLTQYSKVLSKRGDFTQALVVIKQALALDDQDIITLTSYAQLLVKIDYDDQAAQIFQQALELDGENIIALSNYARLLAKSGCNQQAAQLFEKALKLSPLDTITLGWYVQFLIKQGNYQQACNLLDQVVADEFVHFSSRDTHSYSSFKHAQTLEAAGRYPEALDRLLKIDLSQQQPYHANIIRLNLGRLYYLLGQAKTGQDYFNTAIDLADDPDQTRFYAARSLLAHRLDLDTAIDLLQSIDEDSSRYTNARNAIALNAPAQTAYHLFSDPNQSGIDPELLYRAMYHKIGNEVAILKSIAQRLLRKIQNEHPLVAAIVESLDQLQASILQERSNQKAAIDRLNAPEYRQVLQIIAETAHNVSDRVNNELAVIESKTRRTLRKLDPQNPHTDHFNRLLYQLELTQSALSDLKSISEGMPIQRRRFPVSRLFAKWQPEQWSSTPRIQKARVRLSIDNPDSEFDGDEEKIKSILNELVENSLKHNANHRDLLIRIYSRDLLNPTDIAGPTIPGDRRYLYLKFIDNGQGIPQDKKDWIFQPLHTTSSDEKGSGLGLFIIRKTIQQMGGVIQEVGEPDQGVRFQIYLPYLSDSDIP